MIKATIHEAEADISDETALQLLQLIVEGLYLQIKDRGGNLLKNFRKIICKQGV